MLDCLRTLLTAPTRRSERGASAVEYGLLVAGVALACILALEVLGAGVRVIFDRTNSQLTCTGCSASSSVSSN